MADVGNNNNNHDHVTMTKTTVISSSSTSSSSPPPPKSNRETSSASVVVKNGGDSTNSLNPNTNLDPVKSMPGTPSKVAPGKPAPYGAVVISLENPILPEEKIRNTPSIADGLSEQDEYDLRVAGCKMIQIAGQLLRLPQVAMATGQVLFHRYYYCKSFVRAPWDITAMACVVLASKVEEAPRRIRDILNVFHELHQIRAGIPSQSRTPMLLNGVYIERKKKVIECERRILKELGFCVHVKHPHKFIVAVAQILKNESNMELIQASWSYMNDSLQTNVFVRFPPETIACACIHLSSRILKVPLPTKPLWYELFGVSTETIEEVCHSILRLYTRKPASVDLLDAKAKDLKAKIDEAKRQVAIANHANTNSNNNNNNTNTGTNSSPVVIMVTDSQTNSPKTVNEHHHSGKGSLDLGSVISRLKENRIQRQSPLVPKDSLGVEQEHGDCSCKSSDQSSSNTPIKLEKSPAIPSDSFNRRRSDRSRSPTSRRYDSDHHQSRTAVVEGSSSRTRNGHHYEEGRSYSHHHQHRRRKTDVEVLEEEVNDDEDEEVEHHRSRRSPRSYVASVASHVDRSTRYRSRSPEENVPAQYRNIDDLGKPSSKYSHRDGYDREKERYSERRHHHHHHSRSSSSSSSYKDDRIRSDDDRYRSPSREHYHRYREHRTSHRSRY